MDKRAAYRKVGIAFMLMMVIAVIAMWVNIFYFNDKYDMYGLIILPTYFILFGHFIRKMKIKVDKDYPDDDV